MAAEFDEFRGEGGAFRRRGGKDAAEFDERLFYGENKPPLPPPPPPPVAEAQAVAAAPTAEASAEAAAAAAAGVSSAVGRPPPPMFKRSEGDRVVFEWASGWQGRRLALQSLAVTSYTSEEAAALEADGAGGSAANTNSGNGGGGGGGAGALSWKTIYRGRTGRAEVSLSRPTALYLFRTVALHPEAERTFEAEERRAASIAARRDATRRALQAALGGQALPVALAALGCCGSARLQSFLACFERYFGAPAAPAGNAASNAAARRASDASVSSASTTGGGAGSSALKKLSPAKAAAAATAAVAAAVEKDDWASKHAREQQRERLIGAWVLADVNCNGYVWSRLKEAGEASI